MEKDDKVRKCLHFPFMTLWRRQTVLGVNVPGGTAPQNVFGFGVGGEC